MSKDSHLPFGMSLYYAILNKRGKQTLTLSSFLGISANSMCWRVFSALQVNVPLRFQGFLLAWAHSLHAALCGGAFSGFGTARAA
jgi:hypothetical protein